MIGHGDITGAVNSLCFSRADSGTMLVAIDDSVDKIISVWEWQRTERGHKITETRVRLVLNRFRRVYLIFPWNFVPVLRGYNSGG